jgi:tetratricopeptide (TPR) repeat protein
VARAIACFQAALCVYSETDFPLDWAMTQNNLGIAYKNLPTGNREENLARAIACFQAALRVYTETDFPIDWAMTQWNLGRAYERLAAEGGPENLARAISCHEAAARGYAAAGLDENAAAARERAARLRET